MSGRTKSMRLFIAILLVGTIVAAVGCGGRISRQQTDLGDTYLRLGDVEQAMIAYQKALEADPGSAQAQLGLARCFRQQEAYAEALDGYKKAIGLAPDLEVAYQEAVDMLLRESRYDEARELAQQYTETNPELGGVLLARLEVAQNQVDEAIDQLTKLKAEYENSVAVRIALGRALHRAERNDEAVEELEEVTSNLEPGSMAARMALIEVFQDEGRVAELVEQLKEFAQEHPENTGIQLALARALLTEGQFDDAETIARPILAERPESGWANFVVGASLLKKGSVEEALACLEAAAYSLPDEQVVTAMLRAAQRGGVEMAEGSAEDAENQTAQTGDAPQETAASSDGEGDSWQALWNSARLMDLVQRRGELVGDPEAAEAVVAAAMFMRQYDLARQVASQLPAESEVRQFVERMAQGDPEGVMELLNGWSDASGFRRELRETMYAYTLGAGGARAAALRKTAEILSEWPGHGVPLLNLAMMYGDAKMHELQAQILKRLAVMHQNNVMVQTLLFGAYLNAGEDQEARNQAELSYALFPDDPQILRNLGYVYRNAGEMKLAEQVIRRALESAPDLAALRLQLAEVLFDNGEVEEMRKVLEEGQFTPDVEKRAEVMRAFADMQTGNPDAALRLWESSSDTDWNLPVRILLSSALIASGKTDDAMKPLMDGGKVIHPEKTGVIVAALKGQAAGLRGDEASLASALAGNPELLWKFVYCLACLEGRFQTTALPMLREIEAKLGGNAGLATPLLRALHGARIEGDRVEQARAVVAAYPESPDAWYGLSVIARSEGESATEGEALKKATELAPGRTDLWFAYAVYLDHRRSYAEAEQVYRHILENAPDDSRVKNNLAYTLLELDKNLDEALGLALEAREALGRQTHVLHTLGLAQFRSGELDTALENLGLALEIRPGDPTLLFDFGQALIKDGQVDEGKKHIQLALQYADQLGLDFPRRTEAMQALEAVQSQ